MLNIEKAIFFLKEKRPLIGSLVDHFDSMIPENQLFYNEQDNFYFLRIKNYFIIINGDLQVLNLNISGQNGHLLNNVIGFIYGVYRPDFMNNKMQEISFEQLLTHQNEDIRKFIKILLGKD